MIKICPVCNSNLDVWSHSEYGWGVMEEGGKCKSCDYAWEFSYGSYFVVVNKEEFTWSYNDSGCWDEINVAIAKAKNENP